MLQNPANENALYLLSHETQVWLKKTITNEYPEWVGEVGSCDKCIQFYSSLSNLEDVIKEIKI